jgi:hypothetical protein
MIGKRLINLRYPLDLLLSRVLQLHFPVIDVIVEVESVVSGGEDVRHCSS